MGRKKSPTWIQAEANLTIIQLIDSFTKYREKLENKFEDLANDLIIDHLDLAPKQKVTYQNKHYIIEDISSLEYLDFDIIDHFNLSMDQNKLWNSETYWDGWLNENPNSDTREMKCSVLARRVLKSGKPAKKVDHLTFNRITTEKGFAISEPGSLEFRRFTRSKKEIFEDFLNKFSEVMKEREKIFQWYDECFPDLYGVGTLVSYEEKEYQVIGKQIVDNVYILFRANEDREDYGVFREYQLELIKKKSKKCEENFTEIWIGAKELGTDWIPSLI